MPNDTEKLIEQLETLDTLQSSNDLIKKSVSSLNALSFRNKKFRIKNLIFLLVSLIIALLLYFGQNTIENTIYLFELFNSLDIALFGITFTGFAFFQAILNDKLIEGLLLKSSSVKKDSNAFVVINNSFYYLMTLYFISIVANSLLLIICKISDSSWGLFSISKDLTSIISVTILLIYMYFNSLVIWEIKYFLYNLFNIFNSSIIARIFEKLNQDKK